jgi:hypothetical protein
MEDYWLTLLIVVVAPVLFALLLLLSARIERAILMHVRQTELRSLLLRLNDAVFDAVGLIQQTVVVGLKEAAKDGRLTAEERRQVAGMAAQRARDLLGEEGVQRVREVLGTDDAGIERLVVAKIERAVSALKVGETKPATRWSIAPPKPEDAP